MNGPPEKVEPAFETVIVVMVRQSERATETITGSNRFLNKQCASSVVC